MIARQAVHARQRKILRLAIIVSHPIQYYVPLYQRLARRTDLELKVFFTWHSAQGPVEDRGFRRSVAWDIPLTDGYAFESIPNTAAQPGTHHFTGLRNPHLIERVSAWNPDVVQVTGWAWQSHLRALQAFSRRSVPTLFRGDSHLLDPAPPAPRPWIKKAALRRVFAWPTGFLVVGSANSAYYEAFGVGNERLFPCPHSIDVRRFAQPSGELEQRAAGWRQQLGIGPHRTVLLFAGKFEPKKRPVELMLAVQALQDPDLLLLLVGDGELAPRINAIAAADPGRFRVLPFQNQSRMPIVYRLGDLFVLPSAYGETWGLSVNEAMACGRPVLVSDRVGCASDVVDPSSGRVFVSGAPDGLLRSLAELAKGRNQLTCMARSAAQRAWNFDIGRTETTLVDALERVCQR